MTKLNFFNLCLPLLLTFVATVVSLPLTTQTYPDRAGRLLTCRDVGSGPRLRLEVQPSPPSFSASAYLSSYPNHHLNQSNEQSSLPQFHSGPWDRAWEAWNGITEKLKIFKRGLNVQVQEEIANHLRLTDWAQKIKDFWRRFTFRKLKVTRAQYDQVKNKYRPKTYPAYLSQYKKDGRLRSAFVSRPDVG